MLSLETLFASLDLPPVTEEQHALVSAALISDHEHFRVAKDSDGRALLLARVPNTAEEAMPPLVLEHLRVERARPCRVRRSDGAIEPGIFTVITCSSHDAVLRSYFLSVAGLIVESSVQPLSTTQLQSNVEAFVELFRSLQQPARKSAQGLWAELVLILRSRRPDALIRAWHTQPGERFDFCIESDRVEVKSTVGPHRKHHFSQAQLDVPQGTNVVVASMFVERAGGGVSVRALVDRIGARISSEPDLLLRIESVVAATLGSSIRASSAESFDLERAEGSLQFFAGPTVPHMPGPIPPAISDLRFVVDLGGVPPVDLQAMCDEREHMLMSCLLVAR